MVKRSDNVPPLPWYHNDPSELVRYVDRWGYHWVFGWNRHIFWCEGGWRTFNCYFSMTRHRLPKSWDQPSFFRAV